jgi:tRNA(fMet)-specific endonuclease VapC
MKCLLDTNIIIFWLKNRYNVVDRISEIGLVNCFVSDVTVAELRYGVECSEPALIDQKRERLADVLARLRVIPFAVAIELYAKEKARLRSAGETIPDFDLLIGATAVQQNMKMVTNNTKHLSKIQGINIEDWTLR